MGISTESNNNLNSGNLIVFFYKRRKPLLIVTILALIVSIGASLLIQNKYKSTVVLFPSTTGSISKAILNEVNYHSDLLELGDEDQADQMIQILFSDDIRNEIIERYNLAAHYDIEAGEFQKSKLQKEFESNITFERTKFMSVEISVMDHNPDTAMLIANDIAALMDTVNNKMKREVANQALSILYSELNSEQKFITELEDSLMVFSKIGIIDITTQSERLTEQLATAILQGKTQAITALDKRLEVLSVNAAVFKGLQDELWREKERETLLKDKIRESKIDIEKSIQHKFTVNRAFAAEKKSYPIRWLIVVISTFSSFLFTLVFLLFVESIKSTDFK